MVPLETGVQLGGRYRLLDRVAFGGMAAVWEAEDTALRRRVAIKTLAPALAEDHQFVERFRREARAAAGLTHPNVAAVFDYGEDEGTPFMVMELLRGETLAERLRRGRVEVETACRIVHKVATALQAAHDAGIVHRDVKPANIMLTDDGAVKVMDFGIAAAQWAAPLTGAGTTIGTPSYVSPEQAAGRPVTPASDVYSLGVVLYEMLAGRPPFVGDSPVAVASAHVNTPPPPLRDLALDVPPAIAEACERALEKDPDERPRSALAFAASLTRGEGGAGSGDRAGGARTEPLVSAPTSGAARTEQLDAAPDGERPAAEALDSTSVLPTEHSIPLPPRRSWRRVAALIAAAVALWVIGFLAVRALVSDAPPAAPERVRVPQVEGMAVREATSEVRSVGLVVGDVVETEGAVGIVISVEPPAGTVLSPRSPVTLYVGVGNDDAEDAGGGPPDEPPGQSRGKGRGEEKDKGGNGDD